MLFNYELKDGTQCSFPQDSRSGKFHVSWFWLTDSFYHVDLGGVNLFEYSREMRDKYNLSRYDDYPYIRFLEDFFDILPEICTSVPDDIYERINTIEKRDHLRSLRDATAIGLSDDMVDAVDSLAWVGRMDAEYLAVKSSYALNLCYDGDVHITYDFRDADAGNFPVWTAGVGEYLLSYDSFFMEIESLLNRFFADMDEQVMKAARLAADSRYSLYDGGGVDFLINEHKERKAYFYDSLRRIKAGEISTAPDWTTIRGYFNK